MAWISPLSEQAGKSQAQNFTWSAAIIMYALALSGARPKKKG
jgi:hypothetical protein